MPEFDEEDWEEGNFDIDKLIENPPTKNEMLLSMFAERTRNPMHWIRLANTYVVGAHILFQESYKGSFEFVTKINRDDPDQAVRLTAYKDLYFPAKFLLAQACELALKAISLSQGIAAEELFTHNLPHVAAKAELRLKPYELELLQLMQREISWASRYPLPNDPTRYDVSGVDLGFVDTRRYKVLGTRLYRKLYRILLTTLPG